jgi:hypothetical protein
LKDMADEQELIDFLAASGLRLTYDIRLTPSSLGELKIPFMFLYIMSICQENSRMSIPEAISSLRRRQEVVAFREHLHEILADMRSETMAPTIRDGLNIKLEEMMKLLQNAKYARGVQTARLSLLPFLETGAQTAKPFLNLLKALPKGLQELLSFRIPRWMFEEHLLSDRLVVMWQLFAHRAELRNARELFNAHWTKHETQVIT